MWNKPQPEPESQKPVPLASPPAPAPPSERTAVLGPSIIIKGNLSGAEDLLIEGQVEGEISFEKHSVTVSKSGRVAADLHCRSICVEGQVEGNLHGDEIVVVRATGRVKGNARAPRISLEDGALFKGNIDVQAPTTKAETEAREAPGPAQAAGRSSPSEATRQRTDRPPSREQGGLQSDQGSQGGSKP